MANYFDNQFIVLSSLISAFQMWIFFFFLSSSMTVNWIFLSCGQIKTFEDVIMGFWQTLVNSFHHFLTFYWPNKFECRKILLGYFLIYSPGLVSNNTVFAHTVFCKELIRKHKNIATFKAGLICWYFSFIHTNSKVLSHLLYE